MTTSKIYNIVQFDDGLAIMPSLWLKNNETKCAYPTFRDPTKIKKAVASQLPPEDPNWKIYDILRIFYKTSQIYFLIIFIITYVDLSIMFFLFF